MNLKNFLRIGAIASVMASLVMMLAYALYASHSAEYNSGTFSGIKALSSFVLIFAIAGFIFSIGAIINNFMDGETDGINAFGIISFVLLSAVSVLLIAYPSLNLDIISKGTTVRSETEFLVYGLQAIPMVSLFVIPLPIIYTVKE